VTAGSPGPVRGAPAVTGPGGWLVAEAATVVGAACVVLHVATALAPGRDAGWVRAVLLVMAAACVPCLRRLRRRPDRRAWVVTGGMYAAMLVAHLAVLSGAVTSSAGAGMADMAGSLTWTEVGMWAGLALAAVPVVLAAAVLAAVVVVLPGARQPT